ncbi:MAG: flagellar hook-length control protein FliK [Gammaproteobacteria bacterium]
MNFPLPVNVLSASSPPPAGADTVRVSHESVPAAAFVNAMRGSISSEASVAATVLEQQLPGAGGEAGPATGQETGSGTEIDPVLLSMSMPVLGEPIDWRTAKGGALEPDGAGTAHGASESDGYRTAYGAAQSDAAVAGTGAGDGRAQALAMLASVSGVPVGTGNLAAPQENASGVDLHTFVPRPPAATLPGAHPHQFHPHEIAASTATSAPPPRSGTMEGNGSASWQIAVDSERAGRVEAASTLSGAAEGGASALAGRALSALGVPGTSQAAVETGSGGTVKLPADTPAQWRQPLLDALGDRLQVQVGRRVEQATIRLDPPMLGTIEILVRHEAGSLQIQLIASNGEVLRQLHGLSDALRQDLIHRQYGDVAVLVSDSGRDGEGRPKRHGMPEPEQPGQALAEAETGQVPDAFGLTHDIV